MSTVKTKVYQEEVVNLLKKEFDPSISKVLFLTGGEHSQAFEFSTSKGEFVIRVNKKIYSYDKDKYAFEHFRTSTIPIPEIFKIGKFSDELFYAISKKAEGKTFDLLDEQTTFKLLPQLINILDEIHSIKLQDGKYGYWDAFGNASIDSWKEFMLHRDDEFVNSHLGDHFIKELYQAIQDLEKFLPEDRYLVHGDFGFNNLVTDGEVITGVLDWGEGVYGDFVYDIAWLNFWSSEMKTVVDYKDVFKKHYQQIGKKLENFEERLLCYELQIGLSSLGFFERSEQKDNYEMIKTKVLKMLDNTPQES